VPYSHDVSSDVWVGATTTLIGAVVGGAISFLLGWQQVREARRQRREDDVRERYRHSADRRFQAYSDFLTRARSFRNAVETHYSQPGHQPSVSELDSLLQAANDASTLVFLVVESEATYEACRRALRALGNARALIHDSKPGAHGQTWASLNELLGRATREFQNAARAELGVAGPAEQWDSALAGQQPREP
jgi:hypothetical protein